MKKFLLFLTLMFGFLAFTNVESKAQNIVISNNKVFTIKGATADTLILNGSNNYVMYVANFAIAAKVGIVTTNVRGKSKTKTILYGSLDAVNYTKVDSVTITGAGTGVISKLSSLHWPYIKIGTTAIDSTGTTRYKYNILIEKDN